MFAQGNVHIMHKMHQKSLFFYENDINMFTNNIYNIKTIKNIKPDKTKTVP